LSVFGNNSGVLQRRGIRFLLAWLWGKTLLVALLAGAATGLTVVAFQPAKRGAQSESRDRPGSGITVRADLVDIWVPDQIYQLAKRAAANANPLSRQALDLQLMNEGGESLWYAVTFQFLQEDGGISEITTIEHPYNSTKAFPSFADLLGEIAGKRQDDAGASAKAPAVHLIPEELSKRPPREAVAELLKEHRAGR
jgi:hypothetical protein